MATFYREKKPKRADFIFNKKRYWITELRSQYLWIDEYILDYAYECKNFETDEDGFDGIPEDSDEYQDFVEKMYDAGLRVMSPYAWKHYIEYWE